MPNRILREGLLDSERLSKAGEKAEVLFMRLLLVADDFGRFDGRVSVICRRCWPQGLDTDPQPVDVLERLVKLTEQQLVVAYESDGKPFIYIPKFKQRTRASKSKFPEPPASCPQLDGPMTDTSSSGDGQGPGRWQAAASVVRSSSFVDSDSGAPVDKSTTSTPKAAAHSISKAKQQIEQQRKWKPSPMPENLKPRVRTHEDPEPPPGDHHDPGFETLDS